MAPARVCVPSRPSLVPELEVQEECVRVARHRIGHVEGQVLGALLRREAGELSDLRRAHVFLTVVVHQVLRIDRDAQELVDLPLQTHDVTLEVERIVRHPRVGQELLIEPEHVERSVRDVPVTEEVPTLLDRLAIVQEDVGHLGEVQIRSLRRRIGSVYVELVLGTAA